MMKWNNMIITTRNNGHIQDKGAETEKLKISCSMFF